jgi:hypothetical protein
MSYGLFNGTSDLQGECNLSNAYVYLSTLNMLADEGLEYNRVGMSVWVTSDLVARIPVSSRIYSDGSVIYLV